jgi:excinuclease ABC subunit C
VKKILLSQEAKNHLELISGQQIYVRNSFPQNQSAIGDLMEQGRQNALIYLQRNKLGQKLSILEENNVYKTVVSLKSKLRLINTPRHIECYDISHISGKFVYGSMVTFIDGLPMKKRYRLFRCPDQNDDFKNHREVLRRRFNRALAELQEGGEESKQKSLKWKLPNLIIVDGGKGQLSSDVSIVEEFQTLFAEAGLPFHIELAALAKREEEIFLPYESEPVLLEGSERFLVQRIRDEAHRFAITNNRKARLKTASKSELENINGIGAKTKTKLLQVFGSVPNLVQSLDQNPELVYETVGKTVTQKLMKHYQITH